MDKEIKNKSFEAPETTRAERMILLFFSLSNTGILFVFMGVILADVEGLFGAIVICAASIYMIISFFYVIKAHYAIGIRKLLIHKSAITITHADGSASAFEADKSIIYLGRTHQMVTIGCIRSKDEGKPRVKRWPCSSIEGFEFRANPASIKTLKDEGFEVKDNRILKFSAYKTLKFFTISYLLIFIALFLLSATSLIITG